MQIEISCSDAVAVPTPVNVATKNTTLHDGALRLVPDNGGVPLLAQKSGNEIVALLRDLPAGLHRFRVEEAPHFSGVELSSAESTLALGLPEGEFGIYHFEKHAPRPYLWPLLGPGGRRMTRNFPMEDLAHEEKDHKHHRSLWTAFDEVNGTNNWSEEEGHGHTRHERFLNVQEGAVFGGFTAQNNWTSEEDKPILREERSLRLYNVGDDYRLFDYDITWRAEFGEVTFGDTKEAGVLAVRVATSMDGARGGTIENSEGGVGEAACWGHQAAWCDYSGHVDGEVLGIAIFDHPNNPNFPTRWHVRDYGLFATNPLSKAAFDAGAATPFVLKNGEDVTFYYRVLLHRGAAKQGRVAEFYRAFSQPPLALPAP